ncbi:MAG: glycogen synthase [Deltaproteobacteria bacterium]|nr:glycogen synthase [Deltaproteobacteria bacterium]
MKAALLTREFPPEIYGGAGVHIDYLSRELEKLVDIEVHCFGGDRESPLVAGNYRPWDRLDGERPELGALRTLSVDLAMAANLGSASLVHSHTWYANMAGHFAKLLYGIPHVMTGHSLEPLRPWKEEQLAGGYQLSSFCERTAIESADAVIAVSNGMRDDILRCYPEVSPERVLVIHNGIDPEEFSPKPDPALFEQYGIPSDRPAVVFVGRITRQKGVVHLLEAARRLSSNASLVLCAGEPDTDEIAAEFRERIDALRKEREHVIWIEKMLPRPQLIGLLSACQVFVCPSTYEPFGIVNLEAMACGLPVVATAVGGIPEIVVPGETGALISYPAKDDGLGTPTDPEKLAADLAAAIDELAAAPDRASEMGKRGRVRAAEHFSWATIAERTAALYRQLAGD